MKKIESRQDADEIRPYIEVVYDGWFADEPAIDWDYFIDRLEMTRGCDLGGSMDSPAIRRIKAIVRELRRSAQ